MAEVFGAVGAGVGVAAATGQLIDSIMKLHSFCSQIRNIPDDIQTAVDDLSTMLEVLEFVQVEMGHETLPLQPSNLSSSMKVLSNLQQSSQQVGEVLDEMRIKLGKKKYWGRIKAVGMIKKLEKAAKRVENAQRMVLIMLAVENRMSFRQSSNAQRREFTAISTRVLSNSSADQCTGKISRDIHAVNDIESSSTTTDKNPDTSESASHQTIQRTSNVKSRKTAGMKLRLPSLFLYPVWEFSVYKANQGWDFSLRSYSIRPYGAQIFKAICGGNLSKVRELLHSGKASIWDRDPDGRGVLHFAASSCADHGSAVLEYLVKSGADIYDIDSEGLPPYYLLTSNGLSYLDEQKDLRLVAGYKIFMSHRDWIPPRPSARVPYGNFEATSGNIDMFPIFRNPPKEIIFSVLQEMWPPWITMSPADRVKTLFPEFGVVTLTGTISPICMRALLSRKDIQETFANWGPLEKDRLITHTFRALAEQLAAGFEKGIEEARLFLRDMHMTNNLVNVLPIVDYLRTFVSYYVYSCFDERKQGRWTVERFVNAAQEGLKHYISELVLSGIDMATVIDIERKVLARRGEESAPRKIFNYGLYRWYKFIAINYGPKVDDWYLWLSNPLDEWAGEFWDMIDHPERTIPGAWEED